VEEGETLLQVSEKDIAKLSVNEVRQLIIGQVLEAFLPLSPFSSLSPCLTSKPISCYFNR